jgi:hypothetical protein
MKRLHVTDPGRPADRLYLRDARQLRKLTGSVLEQLASFEAHSRSGVDDQLRFLLIQTEVQKMRRLARRAAERYWREHGGKPACRIGVPL